MKLAGKLVLGLSLGSLTPLASCVLAPERVEIAEVRAFPEFGGWLPVSSEGRVVAQLVRPREAERWRAPATQAQALGLLRSARQRDATRPLIDTFEFVLAPLLLLPAAHFGAAEPAPARGPRLECVVLDEAQLPIAGAAVEFVPERVELECFVDEGLREFGTPRIEPWSPSLAWLESLARTGPRCVAVRVEAEWQQTEVFDAEPPQLALQRATQRETSAEGRTHIRTSGPGFVLAWSPGFEPKLARIPDHGTEPFRLQLRALPNRDPIVAAVRRLRAAQAQVARAPYGQGLLERAQIDFRLLADARGDLQRLLQSPDSPGWLRGNARIALELALEAEIALCETATSWWSIPAAPGAEARLKDAREELRSLRETSPPSLRLEAGGVGGWADQFRDWLERARETGLPNDPEASTPARSELRAQARELALRARELDATHPLIELLESIGSPPPLAWPALVHATRFLDTDACFELLHPELRGR